MVGSSFSAGTVQQGYPAVTARFRRGRKPMIAVAAHTDSHVRAQVAETLLRAGWNVYETDDAEQAIALCREREADVLLVGEGLAGVGAGVLLERVKRDAELFRTAVVVLGGDLDPAEVLEWLEQGADDVLLTPPDPADVLGRAFAAARTKALVKELTARNDRLEELVLFDELTGLRNRRAILHELDVMHDASPASTATAPEPRSADQYPRGARQIRTTSRQRGEQNRCVTLPPGEYQRKQQKAHQKTPPDKRLAPNSAIYGFSPMIPVSRISFLRESVLPEDHPPQDEEHRYQGPTQ